jgi:hypothetical protein
LLALGVLGVGVAVQIPGALVDFMETGSVFRASWSRACDPCTSASFHFAHFLDPANTDLRTQTFLLARGQIDLAWRTFAGTWVVPVTWGAALLMLAAGVALLYSVRTERAAHRAPRAEQKLTAPLPGS